MCFLHRCGGKSLGWVRSALILSNFSFLPSLFFHFSTFSLCSAGVRCSFFFCFIVYERVCVCLFSVRWMMLLVYILLLFVALLTMKWAQLANYVLFFPFWSKLFYAFSVGHIFKLLLLPFRQKKRIMIAVLSLLIFFCSCLYELFLYEQTKTMKKKQTAEKSGQQCNEKTL